MAQEQVNDTANFREEGKPVDLSVRIPMVATAKNPNERAGGMPNHKEGEVVEMHPNIARHLFNQGYFTYKNAQDEKDNTHVSQVVQDEPGVMTTQGTKPAAKDK